MSDKNGNAAKPNVEELRAEIQQTRSELGETVQALAAKADVKARAKDQVELTKQKVRAQAVEAGEKVKAQAVEAGEKVRVAAVAATDKVRSVAGQTSSDSTDAVYDDDYRPQTSPIPLPLVVAGVAAIVGIILIIRGSRR